jgi:hypothetical protein
VIRISACVALLLLPVWAEEEEAVAVSDLNHEIQLRGGTILVGRLKTTSWKCRTVFGELTIPVGEFKRVQFGRKSDPERVAKVARLIADLASANPDRRNFATAALREEGKFAAPELKEAAKKNPDPEVKRQCEELLKALKLKKKDFPRDDDRVETTRFTFDGTVLQKTFEIHVTELGPVSVKRKDILAIRTHRPAQIHEFKVNGDNTPRTNKWIDTKLTLRKGQRFRISAAGTITFPNWGGNAFTPDGAFNMGNWAGMPMGALIGRMGPSGPMFKIGTNYAGEPAGEGTLHLCLAMNVQGMPSNGEYLVRIELED